MKMTGLAGTPICQRYNNMYQFATLYSRPRRSAWFSAYLYSVPTGKRPKASWKYEPQLAYPSADGNMVPFLPGPVDMNIVESQAVDLDYINSSFSRGHLNPSLHHQTYQCRSATFTLTNVVPQKKWSNDGPWEVLELTVNKTLATYCLGEAYIVTGIMPYQKEEHWMKNRVAVPEYLWSAYCCPNYNQSIPDTLKDVFPTFAAIGRNDPNSTEEIVPIDETVKKEYRGYDVKQMSLNSLEMYLKDRFNTVISVFNEQCG
ncbi:endonuclease domain-containing 1 protein-like isoform X2 [Gambusia affinis]|uniref:endonuclease domain-containing 1 protein-like isoform X2 n=1 Tax=Gambusia affinis TaxID=33528 RepID=UPI001CDBD971|nr:endonuclease domain-containing 1 protein-like isoform X2 [Gambusia affinis]XP_043957451.1 endonuclease domain-containing 1 protein-like isoform X2 [Gambusia affinis]